ncbi:MAG: hypothetical protein ABI772_03140 [Bacteroidota bacterium]
MSNIRNIEDLRSEITRLKEQSKQQEKQLKGDLLQIKEDLKPGNLVMNMISSATGIKMNKNEMLQNGLAVGLTIFLRRIILNTESKAEEKIYQFVDKFSEKIKQFTSSFGKGKEEI